LRFLSLSILNVVLGQAIIAFFYLGLGLGPVAATVAAFAVGIMPAFLITRRWVWQRSGTAHLTKEVLPFWFTMIGGACLAAAFVAVGTRVWTWSGATNLFNLLGLGLAWVVRFLVLELIVWPAEPHDSVGQA
jgi:putative flippase GtrA